MEKKPSSPTTFVQADTHTFRELVQKLTGADDNSVQKLPITLPSRYSSRSSTNDSVGPRRSGFKLQERRHHMRKLEIKTSVRQASSGYYPRQLLSPVPSPVTPLISDRVFLGVEEEDKAIAEKGFYMHPSPRGSEQTPELLPLFPLESPKLQQ
ncbi:hypothetical protein ACHQM5_030034 [Ranunculus cassubicifolius]